MKLKYFDNYLITIMGFVAIYCIKTLYFSHVNPHSESSQNVIASIVDELNIVKKKRNFYQGWADAASGDQLSLDDEIYTHAGSSAVINFKNGQKIELSENSLIKLKNIENNNSINLIKGNLTTQLTAANKQLNVLINGVNYSFNSKNAKLQIEQNQNENKFIVLDGNLEFKTKNTSKIIETSMALTENKKTGLFKVAKILFSPLNPINNAKLYFNKIKKINLNWKSNDEIKSGRLIISEVSSFKNNLVDLETQSNQYEFTTEKESTFFWKIAPTDSSLDFIESPIYSFKTIKEVEPQIIFDQKKYPKFINQKTIAHINWTNLDTPQYELWIKTPNEKETKEIVNTNYYNFELEDIGPYQIKVKALQTDRNEAIVSETNIINLIKPTNIKITTLNQEVINKVIYNNRPISQNIEWESELNNINFKLKIYLDNILLNEIKTENSFYHLELKSPGRYKWEVLALDTTDSPISNMITGNINIKRPLKINSLPSSGAIIELDRPDQLVNFNWENTKSEDSTTSKIFQFEISDDADFKKIIYSKDITINSTSTNLSKMGTYFWRVKIKNNDSIEYSEPISVEIRPIPPLKRPEINPEIKVKIKYIENQSIIRTIFNFFINSAYALTSEKKKIAEWQVPNNSKVKKYIVEIYQDKNQSILVKKIESESSHIIWENPLSGQFFWRVSFVDFWDRTSDFSNLSALNTFEDAPILIKPELPKVVISPPKIEKKIEPVKPVIAQIPDSVVINEKFNFWEIYLSPKIFNYEESYGTDKIIIEGNVLNSFGSIYHQKMDSQYFNLASYLLNVNRGKVFQNKTFTNIDTKIYLNYKKFENFMIRPLLYSYTSTKFEVSNSAVTSKQSFGLNAGLAIEKNINSLNSIFEISAGSKVQYSIGLDYVISSHYTAGTFYTHTNQKTETSSEYGLKFNYIFFR